VYKILISLVLFFQAINGFGQQETPPGRPLTVITYNILNGFDFGKDTLRRHNLQEWMAARHPDVVALQELCAYSPEKLREDATSWGHGYSVLLKTTGYSVGLTSRYPIETIEKLRKGLHHGALHCRVNGIDYLVVHLNPGSIRGRREEARILTGKLEEIRLSNSRYIVLGDFNAHSPFDADLYDPDGYFLNRLRESNKGKDLDGNVINGGLDYSVISAFLSFPLDDVVRKFTHGLSERGSFPTLILGPVNHETDDQLRSRLERIDYILVSEELEPECISAKVCNGPDNDYLSDHYPVMAVFR
jgi:exodeoxyribonuclease-3